MVETMVSAYSPISGRNLVPGVRDGKATARAEFPQFQSFFTESGSESQHQLGGGPVGLQLEYGRTQMKVQPLKLQVTGGKGPPDCLCGVPCLDWDSELGVQDAGGGVRMGMRVDARRHPQEYFLHLAGIGGYPLQQFQLMEAVHHHPSNAVLHRLGQLLGTLVVPVEIYSLQRKASGPGDGQLTTGDYIQTQTLLVEYLGQRRVDIRFTSVDYPGSGMALPELLDKAAAAGS